MLLLEYTVKRVVNLSQSCVFHVIIKHSLLNRVSLNALRQKVAPACNTRSNCSLVLQANALSGIIEIMSINAAENEEGVLARHRQEKKQLQGRSFDGRIIFIQAHHVQGTSLE